MTIKHLYFALQSGEGFSARPETLTSYTGIGYAVGGANDLKVYEVKNESLSYIKFEKLMEDLISSSYDMNTQVIGGWVDDDGVAYIELSDIIESRYVAMELAKARKEKAIYDFAKGKSIYL